MKKLVAAALSVAFVIAFYPALSSAATTCADVESAKSMLKKQTATTSESQAPRSLAGARSQDVQAPRSQDVQAPRSQDVQAPRSAEITKAATLVKEADAACNAGNSAMATEKAKAATQLLKK
jgi:fatty acid/phospholipid biosynthesis enzyme